ncbi:hypothetical protein RRF57_003535 [Xylaria bambusicola]|uniref:Uncharacterized protein n=1 Tax=Xylaria bambusicola TaxID=326684 RepID=A0AAN7U930_9PEZI
MAPAGVPARGSLPDPLANGWNFQLATAPEAIPSIRHRPVFFFDFAFLSRHLLRAQGWRGVAG